MRKLACSLALFVGAAALVTVGASSAAVAQQKDKKDTKKEPKKEDKDKKDVKKDDGPGAVEVYQTKDGWRFRVVGPDGKSIAIGLQGYAKKEDCLAAVELLKATLAKAKVGEPRDEKKDGKKEEKKDDKK